MTALPVELPPELAPAKVAAVEALLAEVPTVPSPPRYTKGRQQRDPCYVCKGRTGAMGGHHLVPGDASSVVPVHPACHRRLHRRAKATSW